MSFSWQERLLYGLRGSCVCAGTVSERIFFPCDSYSLYYFVIVFTFSFICIIFVIIFCVLEDWRDSLDPVPTLLSD